MNKQAVVSTCGHLVCVERENENKIISSSLRARRFRDSGAT